MFVLFSMRISNSTVNEIEEKLRKIQDSPQFFSERAKFIKEGLEHMADIHSFWLEYPDLRMRLVEDKNIKNETDAITAAKKGINDVKDAWKYLTSKSLNESNLGVLGYMSLKVIEKVGKIVEPGRNVSGFRRDPIYSPFPLYQVPSSLVIRMINELCEDIKERHNQSGDYPVELAAEVHMRIAGIQPFKDGNKRTARLFERRILEGFGYPTAYIPYGERDHYLDILRRALYGFKDKRDEDAQRPFFNYIAGKVNVALDDIINDLNISS